jgi:eukaryotic-like serine/threonine-protein kinase
MLGEILNQRYTITASLGQGAMGIVYRAADALTGQDVAVKLLSRDLAPDHEILERFRREGEALRQLRHPNIVGFVDMFEHGRQLVIVMEYMAGGSLHALVRQQSPLSITHRPDCAVYMRRPHPRSPAGHPSS